MEIERTPQDPLVLDMMRKLEAQQVKEKQLREDPSVQDRVHQSLQRMQDNRTKAPGYEHVNPHEVKKAPADKRVLGLFEQMAAASNVQAGSLQNRVKAN